MHFVDIYKVKRDVVYLTIVRMYAITIYGFLLA